jgi:putative transposase
VKNTSDKPQRKSVRLKEYDYSIPGWYYVTLCTYDRINVFGKVFNAKMRLNESGNIVEQEWLMTKKIRSNVDLDYYVIMPNHIHGIIILNSRGELNSPTENIKGRMQYAPTNSKFRSPSQTLGAIIKGFKSSVTKRIRATTGGTSLKVWQRNYYENVIRNELDLHNIRQYIELNPFKWELDEYYN